MSSTPIGYGIDLSHHQDPAKLPWELFRGHVDFVFARASYGGKLLDKNAPEHVRRARGIGAKVGLYQFYRPSQTVAEHWDAFRLMVDRCGIVQGDLVPALDIELDPLPKAQPVTPAWSDACEELSGKMLVEYGDCIIYVTQREWGFLGRPSWVLDRPLWCAFYSTASKVASPNDKAPLLWQHRVDDFVPYGGGGYDKEAKLQVDQSRLFDEIPLIGAAPTTISNEYRERVNGQIALALDHAVNDDDFRALRRVA